MTIFRAVASWYNELRLMQFLSSLFIVQVLVRSVVGLVFVRLFKRFCLWKPRRMFNLVCLAALAHT